MSEHHEKLLAATARALKSYLELPVGQAAVHGDATLDARWRNLCQALDDFDRAILGECFAPEPGKPAGIEVEAGHQVFQDCVITGVKNVEHELVAPEPACKFKDGDYVRTKEGGILRVDSSRATALALNAQKLVEAGGLCYVYPGGGSSYLTAAQLAGDLLSPWTASEGEWVWVDGPAEGLHPDSCRQLAQVRSTSPTIMDLLVRADLPLFFKREFIHPAAFLKQLGQEHWGKALEYLQANGEVNFHDLEIAAGCFKASKGKE